MTETAQTAAAEQDANQSPDGAVKAASGTRQDQADLQEQQKEKARKLALGGSVLTPLALLGAVFMLHNMDCMDTGKGPNRVIDHGHYIYIPPNANQGQLQQAAEIAMAKGWTQINVHSSKGAKHPAVGVLAQMAPQISFNAKPPIGSFYTDKVNTIVGAHYAKVAAQSAQHAPAAVPQQPAPG